MSLARTFLLASTLVASSLALRLYHGYPTSLVHGNEMAGTLRDGQERTYSIEATEDRVIWRNGRKTRVSNLYIKLATCKGAVSVKLYDPRGQEIAMKGRTCTKKKDPLSINYQPMTDNEDSYNVREEHSIWTFHNKTTLAGTYLIVVKAEKLPCGKAEYEIMASSKDVRQPPALPDNTCIELSHKFTSRTSVGLKWAAATLPTPVPYKVIKYCVYMIPEKSHSHRCSNHGSHCSVRRLFTKDTLYTCFVSKDKSKPIVNYIFRGLKPGTKYHVDVVAFVHDPARRELELPMAYSQASVVSTHG